MALTPISTALAAYANVSRGPAADPAAAVAAAANAAGLAGDPLAGVGGAGAGGGPPPASFSAMLQDATKVAIGSVKAAEQASATAIAGKTDIREVVAAVTNAELTLETVVAVRDKVINAYNEILRMPI